MSVHERNPNNERHMLRLRSAIDWSHDQLRVFRENRVKAMTEYVGSHYSKEGAKDRVPVNLLEMALQTSRRSLVSATPRALITTNEKRLKATAKRLNLATNALIKEINFADSLQAVVMDALFSIGIMKTGINIASDINLGGFLHDTGQPFADRVDLDAWTHDMTATRWEQIQFAGDRYLVPLEWAKETEQFRASGLQEKLRSTRPEDSERSQQSKLAESLSGRRNHSTEIFHDMLELEDIWLPNERLLLTFAPSVSPLPLRILEYSEPERGPYHFLGFNPVPNNIMPLPPVTLWIDLHLLANELFRKSSRQALRQKTVTVASSRVTNQAMDLIDASDGDAITNDFPDLIKEVRMGGVDNANLAIFMMTKQLFNDMAGNINLLAGLGAQTETLGQDKMLLESASKRIAEMQQKTVEFTKGVVRDLSWFLWSDPRIHKQLMFEVPGTDIKVPVVFSADELEGDFFDYVFDIDPYSMQEQSPGSRLSAITQIIQNVVIPFRDQMASQGVELDLPGLLKIYARYLNMNELESILRFTGAPELDDAGGRRKEATRPPETTRTNVRVNRSAQDGNGDDAGTIRQLLSGGDGPDLLSQVSRRAG